MEEGVERTTGLWNVPRVMKERSTWREGRREGGSEGARVCKCVRKPGGNQNALLSSLLFPLCPLLTLTLTYTYAHRGPTVQPV